MVITNSRPVRAVLAALVTILGLMASALVVPSAHADDEVDTLGPIPAEAPGDFPAEGADGAKGVPATTSVKVATRLAAKAAVSAQVEGADHYYYNIGLQAAVTGGLSANIWIDKPWVDPDNAWHSLAELAAIKNSAQGRQIVEVGWNVDPTTNGDDEPHLFVYHWINGKTTCYNGCGFERYTGDDASPVGPGDKLTPGQAKPFVIQYNNTTGAWWIAYDSRWVGYYPATEWTKADPAWKFTETDEIHAFGEIDSNSDWPCSDMGNNNPGANGSPAAYIFSVTKVGTDGTKAAASLKQLISPSGGDFDKYYTMSWPSGSVRSFYYGGDGSC